MDETTKTEDKQQTKLWCVRLFGANLVKCIDFASISTQKSLENCQIIGVYFAFANINQQNDEFVTKLDHLYAKLNNNRDNEHKLQIVQVVLWAHNDVYGDFEDTHQESIRGRPWYAMPFSEVDLKTRLSRHFRIKSGVPTLVLLDRDGSTISISAQDRLLEDPHGLSFPWRPRPVDQVLHDLQLQKGGAYQRFHATKSDASNGVKYADLATDTGSKAICGFYFAANWCPPCRAFAPQLVDAYGAIRARCDNAFEVVFVSSDRSEEAYDAGVEAMPWLSVPWQQAQVRAELAQLYGVRGIPTLLLLDRNGHVITMDARMELAEDPLGQNFPWKPRAVNVLTERFANKLHDYPAIVLFVDGEETELQFAESVLAPAADAYYARKNINFSQMGDFLGSDHLADNFLQFLVGLETDTSDLIRDLIGLDDVVPLLVAIDLPKRRYANCEYGVEITMDSVRAFVERFENGQLQYVEINGERTNEKVEKMS